MGGPQQRFDNNEGIIDTVVGYSGSNSDETANPTYRNIQDYTESIRVTYDKDKWTYQKLLDYYFDIHTPTNSKWSGTQYRSAIFVHTEEQKQLAEQACQNRGKLGKFVSVEMASDFYRAEEYHQKYIQKNVFGKQQY